MKVAVATATMMLTVSVGAAQAKPPLPGAARDVGARTARVLHARLATAGNLPYHGGPVLHSNRTHLIFWEPAGSGLTFDPGYQTLIERFLQNVAAASRSSTNVYGLTGQYRDQSGPAAYSSKYGGAVVITDPLPPNGCHEPPKGGPGWSVCLTDSQLQQEILRTIVIYGLPLGPGDLYFLVTPNGLGNCSNSSSNTCALGGEATGYCGYHSSISYGLVLYAVIPYNAVPGHCQSDAPRPNASTADPAISTISHEHSEMVTDPLGNAWTQRNGTEDGDLCLGEFGPNIGGSGGSAWNENINGGHYYLQEEWSNRSRACEPHAQHDWASFSSALRPANAWSLRFAAHAHDLNAPIVSYLWSFGDGRHSTSRRTSHVFSQPGNYQVVLRTTDRWGNWAFYADEVTVTSTDLSITPGTPYTPGT